MGKTKIFCIFYSSRRDEIFQSSEFDFTFKFLECVEEKNYDNLILFINEHFNEKISLICKTESLNEIKIYIIDIFHIIQYYFGENIGLRIVAQLWHMINKNQIEKIILKYIDHIDFDSTFSFYLFILEQFQICNKEIILQMCCKSVSSGKIDNFKKIIFQFPLKEYNINTKLILKKCHEGIIETLIQLFIDNEYDEFEIPYETKTNIYTGKKILSNLLRYQTNYSRDQPTKLFKFLHENNYNFTQTYDDYEMYFLWNTSIKHCKIVYDCRPSMKKLFLNHIDYCKNHSEENIKFIKKILLENEIDNKINLRIICRFPELFSFMIDENMLDLNETLKAFIKNPFMDNIPYIDYFKHNKCVYDEAYNNIHEFNLCTIQNEFKKVKQYCDNCDVTIKNILEQYNKMYHVAVIDVKKDYLYFIGLIVDNYEIIKDDYHIMEMIRIHLKKNLLSLLKTSDVKHYFYIDEENDFLTDDELYTIIFNNDVFVTTLFENDLFDINLFTYYISDPENIDLIVFVDCMFEQIKEKYPEKFDRNNLNTVELFYENEHVIKIYNKYEIPYIIKY